MHQYVFPTKTVGYRISVKDVRNVSTEVELNYMSVLMTQCGESFLYFLNLSGFLKKKCYLR